MYERRKRPPKGKPEEILREMPPRSEIEEAKLAAGYAMDLAIKQLKEGTASSQLICLFLKNNSLKEQMEVEKLKHETELLIAKKKAVESEEEQNRKYDEVVKMMAAYRGLDQEWEVVEDDYQEY